MPGRRLFSDSRFDEMFELLPRFFMQVFPFQQPPPGRCLLLRYEAADLLPGQQSQMLCEVSRQQLGREAKLHPVKKILAVIRDEIRRVAEHYGMTFMLFEEASS